MSKNEIKFCSPEVGSSLGMWSLVSGIARGAQGPGGTPGDMGYCIQSGGGGVRYK